MIDLYPLKFNAILKDRIWGGNTLMTDYAKDAPAESKIGESWELSGIEGDISIVSNGFLAGNNLEELIEVYMGDLVGDEIYDKYGREFPLLIKLIDAREDLSIQVHPNDELAHKRHHAWGKTEMWYTLKADSESAIYTGFKKSVDKDKYLEAVNNGNLPDILNTENALPGDVFFIPSGRVHAIGKGIVLAEIQQTSDITYRIFDWNRPGLDGKLRELHTDLSLDAIDFTPVESYKTTAQPGLNEAVNLVDCKYFITNIINLNSELNKDYSLTDSFVIYICTEGRFSLKWDKESLIINMGETILIPAIIDNITIIPEVKTKILEIFISANN